MHYDRQLTISTGGSRKALSWAAVGIGWGELAERLGKPIRGAESHAAYLRMAKARQDGLKDIGGFVGGTLRNGRRKAANVVGRDLITLDLDAIPAGGTQAVLDAVAALGCASCVYSTRKHDPEHPRLRVVLPLDRTASAEEYEPIARRVAEWLGIEKADPTTFQSYRLMYWPSASADSEFVCDVNDEPFLRASEVLSTYRDWRNMAEWPQVPGQAQALRKAAQKAEDPEAKPGLVGAFCRVYDIRRAMEELIPEAYAPTDDPDRYTYTGGSTSGGAIVYDGKWLYSHHATDPAGGRLVNAWDLVRLHKFGDRDGEDSEGTPVNRLPSAGAMTDFALALSEVKLTLARERAEAVDSDFASPAEGDDNWLAELELDRNGKCRLNARNLQLIFHNDPNLAGKFGYNEFRYTCTANAELPWNTWSKCPRDWSDPDDAAMRNYFDRHYGIVGSGRINDSFVEVAQEHRTDDVRDYLEGLAWDGEPRADTLLVQYLRADDTPYTRAVTRKTLVAAVARTMSPGCKFDNVLTLVGAQGIAKSMLVDILGGRWYNDSIQSFNGKDAQELLRGCWLIEIPEVDRFSTKFDSAIIKQFITRRDDIFRESYGHRSASHPRRCIFIATTNAPEFLTDASGNRRWWIVHCRATADSRGEDMARLRHDRDQVWAEAVALWRNGEPLTLDSGLYAEAMRLQQEALADDPWTGIVEEFVARRIPEDWVQRTLEERRAWWNDEFGQTIDPAKLVERQTVCVAEIWCEALGRQKSDLDRQRSRQIGNILRGLPGWEAVGPQRSRAYGVQKTFRRLQPNG